MKEKNFLLKQYEIYIQTAEKVSDRRQSANNYFLVVNSLLLSFTGFLTSIPFMVWHAIVGIAGISISFLWLLTLKSFRDLNSAKFRVIDEIEKNLPYPLFKNEWKYLEEGKSPRKYLKLSIIEQGIPIIFIFLYILIIILMYLGG